eukprot:TRINITY_DN121235_c0_g1_i1.p1 TRINITY_DN121235_c0_g1~~TRINITY_DN121235_c0_g1_i1.p1  ORF type:complete len:704 (+),score=159.67 TRINITY_DN121235_c0_g1_i1:186-2297(+)
MRRLVRWLPILPLVVGSGVATADFSGEVRQHRALIRAAPSSGSWNRPQAAAEAGGATSCTPLKNRGTHSTVDVEIGTPGQKFSVVADTGSNSLIVPSCLCQKVGRCSMRDRCFQGTNRSSTFLIQSGQDGPPATRITFGSGTIDAVVATDMVQLGVIKVNMSNGILLMTDNMLDISGPFEGILGLGLPKADQSSEKNLEAEATTSSSSDGGEGSTKTLKSKTMVRERKGHHADKRQPHLASSLLENSSSDAEPVLRDVMADPVGGASMDGGPDSMEGQDSFADVEKIMDAVMKRILKGHSSRRVVQSSPPRPKSPGSNVGLGGKGVLDQAGLHRFSMCFNDAGNDGVLRLGTPQLSNPLGAVGTMHWSLGFHGISIGGKNVTISSFCSKSTLKQGQQTPCGAIPDSGTTAIMAPQDHVDMMLDALCDEWERCRTNHTALVKAAGTARQVAMEQYGANPSLFQESGKKERKPKQGEKAKVLSFLLADCASWLTKEKGLDEMPSLRFHVAGANGGTQVLELPAWAYVLEERASGEEGGQPPPGADGGPPGDEALAHDHVESAAELGAKRTTRRFAERTCAPAFAPLDYYTELNGPVWVFGTPFFYEYQVGYDLRAEPPAISFVSTKQSPCGSCDSNKSALVTEASQSVLDGVAGEKRAPSSSKAMEAIQEHTGAAYSAPAQERSRQPRRVQGPWRVPSLDTSLPL